MGCNNYGAIKKSLIQCNEVVKLVGSQSNYTLDVETKESMIEM